MLQDAAWTAWSFSRQFPSGPMYAGPFGYHKGRNPKNAPYHPQGSHKIMSARLSFSDLSKLKLSMKRALVAGKLITTYSCRD